MFKLCLCLLTIVVILSSCQKEPVDIFTNTADTVASVKLKQIHFVATDPNDPVDVTFSLEYDSVNRKINVYLDDPSTTNIYDLLASVYEFNTNGYLTKVSGLNSDLVLTPFFAINRNASGQILNMQEYDPSNPAGSPPDVTRLFSYTTNNGLLTVKDSFLASLVPYYQSEITSFNANKTPASFRFYNPVFDNSYKFFYNAQNELTALKGTYDTTEVYLDKSQVPLGWDQQAGIFLGKDAYLLSQVRPSYTLGINFLTILGDDKFETELNFLLSPPLAKITRHGFYGPFGQQQANVQMDIVNTFTSDHKFASVTLTGGRPGAVKFTFSYF